MLVKVFGVLTVMGAALMIVGCTSLLLGFAGLIDFADFDFGESAGVRMLGSVAVAGSMLSAIGYFGLEHRQ